jgi:hypothetical protein
LPRYSRDELADAASACTNYSQLARLLGREPTSAAFRALKRDLVDHAIDVSHFSRATTRYSYKLLSEAAAASGSIAEVVRYLGANQVGGTQAHVGRRLRALGIDISHFTAPRQINHDELPVIPRDDLDNAIRESKSLAAVLRHLGLPVTGRSRRHVRETCSQHGLSLAGLGHQRLDVAAADLVAAVAASKSIPEVMERLGMDATKNAERRVARAIDRYSVDTSHFVRRAWRTPLPPARRDPTEVLVLRRRDRSPKRVPGHRLRNALPAIGRAEECSGCGLGPEWRGVRITLQVDHINGDWLDDRAENLRLLCPNCHSITPNYAGRKRLANPAHGTGSLSSA